MTVNFWRDCFEALTSGDFSDRLSEAVLIVTPVGIARTLFITAAMFGATSFYGYTIASKSATELLPSGKPPFSYYHKGDLQSPAATLP